MLRLVSACPVLTVLRAKLSTIDKREVVLNRCGDLTVGRGTITSIHNHYFVYTTLSPVREAPKQAPAGQQEHSGSSPGQQLPMARWSAAGRVGRGC